MSRCASLLSGNVNCYGEADNLCYNSQSFQNSRVIFGVIYYEVFESAHCGDCGCVSLHSQAGHNRIFPARLIRFLPVRRLRGIRGQYWSRARTVRLLITSATRRPASRRLPTRNYSRLRPRSGCWGRTLDFQTRIYGNGTISGGTLTGDLNLVCEHDITWNSTVFSNPRAPLDFITTQLKATGLTNITGNVQCYGCCFYNLASTDANNHDAANQLPYNASAATNFLAALQAQGITVGGSPIGKTGFTAPGTLLYTYHSTSLTYSGQPLRLAVAVIPMLKVSHNVMADALLRHIGYEVGTGDSFAAGAAKVVPWLATAGVTTNGIVMNDGSGLSHGNRFSATQTVTLLRYMFANYFSFASGLPIGCVDGTLAGRYCGTAGSGNVHGKTGSLSISIALSGYAVNPNDNRQYYFSFIANNQSGIDETDTEAAIDAAR